MTLVIMDQLIPCDVYLVHVGADINFTRVCMNPGTPEQRNWDIDKEDYTDNPEDPNCEWGRK